MLMTHTPLGHEVHTPSKSNNCIRYLDDKLKYKRWTQLKSTRRLP